MYKVIKRDCPVFGIGPYTCEFICDTASDISTLPTSISEGTGGKSAYDNQRCASGSIAIVAENGSESKRYMMNNQNVWCPNDIGTGSSYELPIATTEILGGVMVDGTSITADENGVISAVGGSGGGLTLLGRYSNAAGVLMTIGTLSDIPEGTKLLFMSTKQSSAREIFFCGVGNVPIYLTGYDRTYSNVGMINENNILILQIHNYGPSENKVTFVGNSSLGTYIDIYKLEV